MTSTATMPLHASEAQWDDWRWQLRNQIKTVEQLETYLDLTKQEREQIATAGAKFHWAITPYYARLMDPNDPACPLRLQQVPSIQELDDHLGIEDPLMEKSNSPVDAVVHVYPDRVAFKITNVCPTYCRYCFREYFVGNVDERHTRAMLQQGIDYIRSQPAIRDVLLTGGDPLLFSDQRLEDLLSQLRAIEHVEVIRIGTRTPCTLPQRITPELCSMLEKYHPIWLNTHFNHPTEITAEAATACDRLLRAGIPVGNQSVLLKGVNDSVAVMKQLIHKLLQIRVRPYYIYQCQILSGTAHLRTSIEKGIEIIHALRGFTTGFGVPTYVLDTPYGKVPLAPQYILGRAGDDVVLRAYSGKVWREPNPLDPAEQPQLKLPICQLDSDELRDSGSPFDPQWSTKK
jgi:lysine 2,3-aminomutase